MRRSEKLAGAVVLAVIGLIGSGMIFSQWYLGRNPDYTCLQTAPPGSTKGVLLEAATGTWSWWPTGLTCHFPTTRGILISMSPDPILSVGLVISLAASALSIALFVRSVSR